MLWHFQTQLKTTPKPSFTSIRSGILQRCTATTECDDRSNKRSTFQRSAVNDTEPSRVPPSVHDVLCSTGQPLDKETRAFMEPRFDYDFSKVRVHTDSRAAESASAVNALAYTVGRDVVFGEGQYQPATNEGRRLMAHELTHVLQQDHARGLPATLHIGPPRDQNELQADSAAVRVADGQSISRIGSSVPGSIQRKLELRPPGKGEASAFGRAAELINRLNTVSPAIEYELKGQQIAYTVKDGAALTHFDNVMKGFIDRAELVPMRLITREGYVGGGPLFADSLSEGYVDLDDLLADDLYSFQSDLLHFLTERFQVKDYARRIGTNLDPEFPRAHQAGKNAEAAQLQYLFKDPSIVFVYEETKPNNTWVNAFKSKNHGFWVFQVARKSESDPAGGEMWVKKKDGTRVTMEQFRKERAAAAP